MCKIKVVWVIFHRTKFYTITCQDNRLAVTMIRPFLMDSFGHGEFASKEVGPQCTRAFEVHSPLLSVSLGGSKTNRF
jgi:hypothetical protein